MTTDKGDYQTLDTWELSKRSTERITTLNDMRRQWVRIELAANALINNTYERDPLEQPLVKYLRDVIKIARARIRTIDDDTNTALTEHEKIMNKLLNE